jgi:hypothetical protein
MRTTLGRASTRYICHLTLVHDPGTVPSRLKPLFMRMLVLGQQREVTCSPKRSEAPEMPLVESQQLSAAN